MADDEAAGNSGKRPETLSFEEIEAILFTCKVRLRPPPDWKCGREPAPALPIDEAITTLINKKLLSAEFSPPFASGKCPYFSARRWIRSAAIKAMGMDQLPRARTEQRRHLSEQLTAAKSLKSALAEV